MPTILTRERGDVLELFLQEIKRPDYFERYDYEDAPNAPEISCWPFMKGTFHSPQSWREMSIDG